MKRGDDVVIREPGRIIIVPDLIPQVSGEKTHEANRVRLQRAGENSSFLAGYVFEAIFGGSAIRPGEKFPENNGCIVGSRFRPDHILEVPDAIETTEIKMISKKASQPFCYNGQFFRYYRNLLENLSGGWAGSMFNYALFKYGKRESLRIGQFTNGDLVRILSKQIRDLMVLPGNLAAFLFSQSRFEVNDQTNSRYTSRGYWRPGQLDIKELRHEAPLDAVKLIQKNNRNRTHHDGLRQLSAHELDLDGLISEQFHSPSNIYFRVGKRDYHLEPFPITFYRNRDPKITAEILRERFTRIKNVLGGDPNEDSFHETYRKPIEPDEPAPF